MKKNLEILEIEPKLTKDEKKYWRFKTSENGLRKWMSCFDETTSKQVKTFIGRVACVEVIDSGDFKNIKKCYGEAEEIDLRLEAMKPGDHSNFQEDTYDPKPSKDDSGEPPEVVKIGVTPETMAKPKNGRNPYDKDPVGLVIELVIAGTDIENAIDKVRQAKKAFE